jgi:photosystem II stability/assembly factor-like uncharacterized protein
MHLLAFVFVVLNTGSTASLRGLSVVSDRVIWASGSASTVLHSTDGGGSWKTMIVGDKFDFRDVEAFDARTAVIMSTSGQIYRTTDAEHWTLVHDDKRAGIFLDSIAFDGKHGYAVGDPIDGRFVLLETTDRGATWSDVAGPEAVKGESAFAASGTCIAVRGDSIWIATGGSVARVMRSRDRGHTWSATLLTIPSGNDSSGAFGIAVDGRRVVVAGGDYKRPDDVVDSVVISDDSGATFHLGARLPFRSAVAPRGRNAWIVTGTSSTDLTEDGGHSWLRIEGGFNAVDCSATTCFVAGSNGRVARLQR